MRFETRIAHHMDIADKQAKAFTRQGLVSPDWQPLCNESTRSACLIYIFLLHYRVLNLGSLVCR